MKNFNLKKIVSKKKSGGFALLETLLMLGILVVVTVLTVYTVYAKTNNARHVQINSSELASVYAATSNAVALLGDGKSPVISTSLQDLAPYGAYGSIVEHGRTSDGYAIDDVTGTLDSVTFTITGAGDDDNMKVVTHNIQKLNSGASCTITGDNYNCVFKPAGQAQ